MAQQADRLVSEIRTTRARLGARVGRLGSPDQVVGEVRRHPLAWIGAGLLAGLLVGRVWGPSLLRRGQEKLQAKVRSQLQFTLGSALLAALGPQLGRVRRRRGPSSSAAPGGGAAAS